jgi:hypothetical protein
VDVVIPCSKEVTVLEQSINTTLALFDANPQYDWRVVVADNGSTDGTGALAERLVPCRGGTSSQRSALIRISVVPLVSGLFVVAPLQPVAPDVSVRQAESLTVATTAPSGDLNDCSAAAIQHVLNCWDQVGIASADDGNVVHAILGEASQINGHRDVDSFFLWSASSRVGPVSRVAERTLKHVTPGGCPRRTLTDVGSVSLRLEVSVRPARVETDTGELAARFASHQQFTHGRWPNLAVLVRIVRIIKERAACVPVEILRVDEHHDPLHDSAPQSKTPPALGRAAGTIDQSMTRRPSRVKWKLGNSLAA